MAQGINLKQFPKAFTSLDIGQDTQTSLKNLSQMTGFKRASQTLSQISYVEKPSLKIKLRIKTGAHNLVTPKARTIALHSDREKKRKLLQIKTSKSTI